MNKAKRNTLPPQERGIGSDGFRLSFVKGRGVLDMTNTEISDAVTANRLSLLIPGLSFPFDITAGVRGLRHRRHVLSRLKMTVTAEGFERNIHRRLEGSQAVRLWACSFETDHIAFLVRFGPEDAPVPLSFRLSPALLDDALGFTINRIRPYGPLPVSLITAVAVSVEEMLGVAVRGLEVSLPSLPKQALMALLPRRGWRLPDYSPVRLRELAFLPDRIVLDFCHPELHEFDRTSPFETEADEMIRLLRHEENQIAGPADSLLTGKRVTEARRGYAKLLDRDPDNPFVVARLAMIDVLSPHLRETARSLVAQALARHPGRGDLTAVSLQDAALEGDASREAALLAAISEDGNSLENLSVSLRHGDLLFPTDLPAATKQYERALSSRRDDLTALFALLRAKAAGGDAARVRQLAPRWIAAHEEASERSVAHLQVGEIILKDLSDPAEAVRHFERALVADPDNLRALFGLAESLREMDEVERAVNHFDRLAQLYRKAGKSAPAADALSRLADIWLDRGIRSLAVQRLIEALELDPNHTERRLRLAAIYRDMAQYAKAAKEYEGALQQTKSRSDEGWWGEAALDLAAIYIEELNEVSAAKVWVRAALGSAETKARAQRLLRRLVGGTDAIETVLGELSSPAEILQLAREWRDATWDEKARELLEQAMLKFPEFIQLADELIVQCREAGDDARLLRMLIERVQTVVSPKRRAPLEVEIGWLTLEVQENPATAIFWFKRAQKHGAVVQARKGLNGAFELLERQADQLIDAKEYEAARMLFAVLETDAETELRYAEQREEAEVALEQGDFEHAYQMAMAAAKGSSAGRTLASLIAGRALSEQGRRREAVRSLEHRSKSVDEVNAVALLLAAIGISAKDIEDVERTRFLLEQHLQKHPDREDLDQGIIRLLAITEQRSDLAEYLLRKRHASSYTARLKRAAELFMADGEFGRAADCFEALYNETDTLEALFLLANALRQAGHYETLIKLLDERKNEDSRIREMLNQDLARYAEILKQKSTASIPDGRERELVKQPLSSLPTSIFPPESLNLIEDEEGLDQKLASAFTRLRKKKGDDEA